MKSGRTLQEVAQEVARQKAAATDYVAASEGVDFNEVDGDLRLGAGGWNYPATSLAHRQIGEKHGIPARHYDRLRADFPDLLAEELNRIGKKEPSRRLIRTLDGRVRAFLSDRYRRLDNWAVVEEALPALQDATDGDWSFQSAEVTDTSMYLKAMLPKLEATVRNVGDVVRGGISLQNSEVGLGSLSLQQLVITLICSNGCVMPDGKYRRTHLGRELDDGHQFRSDNTQRLTDRAIMAQLGDTIRGMLSEERFIAAVNRLGDATEQEVTGRPQNAVEEVSKRFSLSDDESDSVLSHLIRGGDLSKYGIHAAMTRASQDVEDYDRASDMEKFGGKVIELPAADWKVISTA